MTPLLLTEEPTETDATSCRMALDRTKGFLGTSALTVAAMDQDIVARYRAMSNEELFPIGEKALGDIADDIIALDEIHTRFHNSKGVPILGYQNWKEFVARNSKYSIRTVQRRLADEHGIDESKVNLRYKQPPEPAVEPPVIEGEVEVVEATPPEPAVEPPVIEGEVEVVEATPPEPRDVWAEIAEFSAFVNSPKPPCFHYPPEPTKPSREAFLQALQLGKALRKPIKSLYPNALVYIKPNSSGFVLGLFDVQVTLVNISPEQIESLREKLQTVEQSPSVIKTSNASC
jgi:hypothetical protein